MNPNFHLVPAVATARHNYDGRALRPGDLFECSDSELADLRVLGFARAAPARPPEVVGGLDLADGSDSTAVALIEEVDGKAAVYETRVLTAEDPTFVGPPQRVKRRYTRRDQFAEK